MNPQECLFCKIIRNEIPSKKVYEDSDVVAFLDINPTAIGHTLVVPKKHFQDIYDVDESSLSKAMNIAKKISILLKDKFGADGVNIIQNTGHVAGQIVMHFHIHVIPRYKNDNIQFHFPRAQLTSQQLDEVQKKFKEEKKHDDFEFRF